MKVIEDRLFNAAQMLEGLTKNHVRGITKTESVIATALIEIARALNLQTEYYLEAGFR